MRDRASLPLTAFAVGALVGATEAQAMPWDVDMVDAQMVRAFEREMEPLPDGVMSQPNLLTPISYRRNWVRESAAGQALANPFPTEEDVRAADGAEKAYAELLATGSWAYETYCWPCHGDGVELGPVGQPGRYPAVAVLAGDAGRLKDRTDGHVYLTIRNGGGIMPSYGWAMTDREMWAIVAWMRETMPNAAAPAPAPEPAESGETMEP